MMNSKESAKETIRIKQKACAAILRDPKKLIQHREAADFLYKTFTPGLKFYFFKNMGPITSAHEADDLVIQTLSKMFSKLHQYDETVTGSMATWVRTIARNTLIDHIRSNRIYDVVSVEALNDSSVKTFGDDSVAIALSSSDRDPYEELERKERHTHLRKCVSKMKNKLGKELLNMHYMEGKKYEEIVEITNLPLGTVKATLHRAKKELLIQLKIA